MKRSPDSPVQRVAQHNHRPRVGSPPDACRSLVYFELHTDMVAAIAREKRMKAGSGRKKIKLIERLNPDWRHLFRDII